MTRPSTIGYLILLLLIPSSIYPNPLLPQPKSSKGARHGFDSFQFIYDVFEVFTENITFLEHDENNNCGFVRSEEGIYTYISPGSSDRSKVCGLYLIAGPNEQIEIEFLEFSVQCNGGGIVAYIDGWERNGQFFPSLHDHEWSRHQRFIEFCGTNKPPLKTFIAGQNAAMIEFWIPTRGESFKIKVVHSKKEEPCNMMLPLPSGIYTLHNYGRKRNCTLTTIFPSTITLLEMNVGNSLVSPQNTVLPLPEASPMTSIIPTTISTSTTTTTTTSSTTVTPIIVNIPTTTPPITTISDITMSESESTTTPSVPIDDLDSSPEIIMDQNHSIDEASNSSLNEIPILPHQPTSLMRHCRTIGNGVSSKDVFEVLGSHGLELRTGSFTDFCGVYASKREATGRSPPRVDVPCQTTAARLVSSGEYHNSVTFSIDLYMDSMDHCDASLHQSQP